MFPDLKDHTTVLIAFFVSMAISLVLTRISISLAWRIGLVDKPDNLRKNHAKATPQMGGPAIFLAFSLPLLGLMIFPERSDFSALLLAPDVRMKVIGLFLGGFLVLVLGMLDDIYTIRPVFKLLGQIAIASLIYFFDYKIGAMSNPFGSPLDFGIFAFPITILWFVGCMNVINLLDGLDGLATGVVVLVSVTLFLVSLAFGKLFGELAMACLGGAAFGFLILNFPPAKIFLGDSGSLLLGFLIAATSIIGTSKKAEAAVALLIPVVALGLPIIDTSLSIVRRWYRKVPIYMADNQHIHHSLVSMGFSKKGAVLMLYLMSICLGGAALVLTMARSEVTLLILTIVIIMAIVGGRLFSGLQFSGLRSRWQSNTLSNRHSRRVMVAIYNHIAIIEQAADFDAMWRATIETFSNIEVARAELTLVDDPAGTRTWRNDQQDEEKRYRVGCWSMTLDLRSEQGSVGELSVHTHIFDDSLDTRTLTGLVEHLSPALVRGRAHLCTVLASDKSVRPDART